MAATLLAEDQGQRHGITVLPDMRKPISVEEMNEAEIQVIKLVQHEAFPQEDTDISANKAS